MIEFDCTDNNLEKIPLLPNLLKTLYCYDNEIKKLQLLSNWQQTVEKLCNCSFLYWISNLVPAFFQDIFNCPDQVNRLPYLFSSFKDHFGI